MGAEAKPLGEAPVLSVVVTVVDGGEWLERCLAAVAGQEGAPPLEVLVPFDPSIAEVIVRTPGIERARVVAMPEVELERPAGTPAGKHELYDRRRSAGLAAARGQYVALLDDRSAPRPDWARTLVRLLAGGAAAVGGAVAGAEPDARAWAEYFCDYGRYQPPFEAGEREYVSDVNVGYSRAALEEVRQFWWPRYHESTLHWAMRRAQLPVLLDPGPVVEHAHAGRSVLRMLRERFEWGRLFATTRVRESSQLRRATLAASSPFLPPILLARLVRQQLQTFSTPREFAVALPFIVLFLVAWSAGELAGYVTGKE